MERITVCNLFFLLLLHLQVAGASDGEHQDFEIIEYNISVRIPDAYDRIEVDALLRLKKVTSTTNGSVRIVLGEKFRGAKMVDVEVTDVHNEPLSFTFDNALLEINLAEMLDMKSTAWVLIEYDITKDETFFDEYSLFTFEICDSLCHINASITRTDNWYPKIEGTMAKRLAPFKLIVDAPMQFEVMASGRLVDFVADKDRKIYTWRNYEGVTDRSLYFFALKRGKLVKEYNDGFRVIMYLSDNAMSENVDYVSDVIHKSYRHFENIFGEAPWNEYKVMVFPYGYSGLFNSMCAPVELFTSAITNNDIYFPIRRVIHEVSHTWWGNIVSSNADENYWLFEGFGKYSEVVGIMPALGVDVESLSFFRLKLCTLPYIDYVPSVKNAQNVDDRTLVNVAAYYMGATYLRMLRNVMGEDNFYKGIKDYVRRNRGKCSSTEDFINAMKKYCRREHRPLIYDYIKNPGYARYDISGPWLVENHGSMLSYVIGNVGDKDIFVPYRVQTDVEGYTKDLFLKKGKSCGIYIKNTGFGFDTSFVVVIDPGEIYPICRAGLKGPGATVYENQQGEVKAYNIASGAPFANAGINEDMSLISINSEDLAGKDLRTLNHMLLQPEGTEIHLMVKTGDAEPYDVTIVY